jgi:hypothetical protein
MVTPLSVQIILTLRAVVAQLDRVPDYESGGRRFESSRPHHFSQVVAKIKEPSLK